MGKGGEIFLFDMGEAVKIRSLAERMIKLSGLEPDKDIEIKYTGLRPGEKLMEELLTKKENTLPTYHEKIFIAKQEDVNPQEVEKSISELAELLSSDQENRDMAIVENIKHLVATFKSNNSIYEVLDEKNEKV